MASGMLPVRSLAEGILGRETELRAKGSLAAGHQQRQLFGCISFEARETYVPLPPGAETASLPIVAKYNKNASLSNCQLLAIAGEEGCVTIASTQDLRALHKSVLDGSWRPRAHFPCHRNAIFDIAWAKGDSLLYTASGHQQVGLWDTHTAAALAMAEGHEGSVKSVAPLHLCEDVFATGARDGRIMLWDARCPGYASGAAAGMGRRSHGASHSDSAPVLSPIWVQEGAHMQLAAAAGGGRGARGAKPAPVTVTSVVFVPYSYLLASGGAHDTVVRLWDMRMRGLPLCDVELPMAHRGSGVKARPSAAGTEPHEVGSFTCPSRASATGVTHIAVSEAGDRLLVSCLDSQHHLLSTSRLGGPPLATWCPPPPATKGSFYMRSAFSPCGDYVLSGSKDCGAHVWSTLDPARPPLALPHEREVTGVAWCPGDWGQVATCSDSGDVRVWTLARLPAREGAANGQALPSGAMAEAAVAACKQAAASRTPATTRPRGRQLVQMRLSLARTPRDAMPLPAAATPQSVHAFGAPSAAADAACAGSAVAADQGACAFESCTPASALPTAPAAAAPSPGSARRAGPLPPAPNFSPAVKRRFEQRRQEAQQLPSPPPAPAQAPREPAAGPCAAAGAHAPAAQDPAAPLPPAVLAAEAAAQLAPRCMSVAAVAAAAGMGPPAPSAAPACQLAVALDGLPHVRTQISTGPDAAVPSSPHAVPAWPHSAAARLPAISPRSTASAFHRCRSRLGPFSPSASAGRACSTGSAGSAGRSVLHGAARSPAGPRPATSHGSGAQPVRVTPSPRRPVSSGGEGGRTYPMPSMPHLVDANSGGQPSAQQGWSHGGPGGHASGPGPLMRPSSSPAVARSPRPRAAPASMVYAIEDGASVEPALRFRARHPEAAGPFPAHGDIDSEHEETGAQEVSQEPFGGLTATLFTAAAPREGDDTGAEDAQLSLHGGGDGPDADLAPWRPVPSRGRQLNFDAADLGAPAASMAPAAGVWAAPASSALVLSGERRVRAYCSDSESDSEWDSECDPHGDKENTPPPEPLEGPLPPRPATSAGGSHGSPRHHHAVAASPARRPTASLPPLPRAPTPRARPNSPPSARYAGVMPSPFAAAPQYESAFGSDAQRPSSLGGAHIPSVPSLHHASGSVLLHGEMDATRAPSLAPDGDLMLARYNSCASSDGMLSADESDQDGKEAQSGGGAAAALSPGAQRAAVDAAAMPPPSVLPRGTCRRTYPGGGGAAAGSFSAWEALSPRRSDNPTPTKRARTSYTGDGSDTPRNGAPDESIRTPSPGSPQSPPASQTCFSGMGPAATATEVVMGTPRARRISFGDAVPPSPCPRSTSAAAAAQAPAIPPSPFPRGLRAGTSRMGPASYEPPVPPSPSVRATPRPAGSRPRPAALIAAAPRLFSPLFPGALGAESPLPKAGTASRTGGRTTAASEDFFRRQADAERRGAMESPFGFGDLTLPPSALRRREGAAAGPGEVHEPAEAAPGPSGSGPAAQAVQLLSLDAQFEAVERAGQAEEESAERYGSPQRQPMWDAADAAEQEQRPCQLAGEEPVVGETTVEGSVRSLSTIFDTQTQGPSVVPSTYPEEREQYVRQPFATSRPAMLEDDFAAMVSPARFRVQFGSASASREQPRPFSSRAALLGGTRLGSLFEQSWSQEGAQVVRPTHGSSAVPFDASSQSCPVGPVGRSRAGPAQSAWGTASSLVGSRPHLPWPPVPQPEEGSCMGVASWEEASCGTAAMRADEGMGNGPAHQAGAEAVAGAAAGPRMALPGGGLWAAEPQHEGATGPGPAQVHAQAAAAAHLARKQRQQTLRQCWGPAGAVGAAAAGQAGAPRSGPGGLLAGLGMGGALFPGQEQGPQRGIGAAGLSSPRYFR